MASRKLIDTKLLEPGMLIEQTVEDRDGHSYIERGTYLDDIHIRYILKRGLKNVYVHSDEEPEPEAEALPQTPEEIEKSIPKETRILIEKERVEDRSNVNLSRAVKERVGKGIQFLFSDTSSEGFMETTHNISDELVRAITENNAVALDVNMIKVSDEYTFKHSVDVATMAMIIGKNYGLSRTELHEIGIAGLLHDIGKSRIPVNVLNKPAKLTDEEFEVMKQHTLFGFQILLEKKAFSDGILKGVLQHHEKINGRGYPQRIDGRHIHKYAKIISVADVFDALVTDRPYKSAFSKRDAVEMIMAMTPEMDLDAMKSFLDSLILYPVDSIVHLSNGELAKVVENVPTYVLRPKVVGLKTGKVYDLSSDLAYANIVIES